MAKKFVRTTGNTWNNKNNKSDYNNSIVFLEDTRQIWSNGIYYGGNNIIDITYLQLKSYRDSSKLIPGQYYKITDYSATTSQDGTYAFNENIFDIIVMALSTNELSHDAKAVGGSYTGFWDIKYSIDKGNFNWVSGVGSNEFKGVIYYMKDEWNNICEYDFKNIGISPLEIINISSSYVNAADPNNYSSNVLNILNFIDSDFYYTFTDLYDNTYDDLSLEGYAFNNKIENFKDARGQYIPLVLACAYMNIYNLNICNSHKCLIIQTEEFSQEVSNVYDMNLNIKNSNYITLIDVLQCNINNTYTFRPNIINYESNYLGIYVNKQLGVLNIDNVACFVKDSEYPELTYQTASINIKNSGYISIIDYSSFTNFVKINIDNVNYCEYISPAISILNIKDSTNIIIDETVHDYIYKLDILNCHYITLLGQGPILNKQITLVNISDFDIDFTHGDYGGIQYTISQNSGGELVRYNLADTFQSLIL